MRRWTGAAVLLAAVLALGCIVKSTTHTLLLEPGGGGTWVVLERNVRSVDEEPAERMAEEQRYLAAAVAGNHDAARALRSLGAESVASSVVRDRRPFAVWTEARFASAADAAERFLAAHGLPACARFESDGDERRLELTLELPQDDDASDDDFDLGLPLPDTLEHLEILLTDGRFVAAEGFEVDGDRAQLIPVSDEEIAARGGTLVLSLSWSLAP